MEHGVFLLLFLKVTTAGLIIRLSSLHRDTYTEVGSVLVPSISCLEGRGALQYPGRLTPTNYWRIYTFAYVVSV